MNETKDKLAVTLPIELDTQRISDLVVNAHEGNAVGYWANVTIWSPEGKRIHGFGNLPTNVVGHCKVEFEEYDERTGEPVETYMLDLCNPELSQVVKGLQLMAEHYKWHFANFMSENDDVETADVFIQLCLLGEVVYG